MSVETLFDESYYPGMGVPDVPAITPVIATPADGTAFTDGQQVVFTGTAQPGAAIDVQVYDGDAWVTLVSTTASGDGVWTTDPYTVDAANRVALTVTAYDAAEDLRSAAMDYTVQPEEVLVAPGATVDVPSTSATVTPDPATPWTPGQSATFSDGAHFWDGSGWLDGVAPTPDEVVAPGATTTSASTDEHVVADPQTAWAAGESATFSDGEFYWDGAAWAAGAAPEAAP